jgi:FkbM family methyltransferase
VTTLPEDVIEIAGGFWVMANCPRIPAWQIETQRLDHDAFLPQYCAQFIPYGGCAVDAGALNGDHAICYSRYAGPDGLVFAIEPGPLAFRCLEHNVTLFPAQNTIAVPFAIGASEGTANWIEHASGDLGMATCETSVTGAVLVKPLDTIIKAGFPDGHDRRVDFIKLDLEGAELEALRGAIRILTNDRPVLVLEINHIALQHHATSYSDITEFLSQHSYRSRQVDGQAHNPLIWDEVCWPAELGEYPKAQH